MFSKAMFEYYEIFIIELGLLHLWPRTPLNALKDFSTGLYEFSEDGADVPFQRPWSYYYFIVNEIALNGKL